MLINRTVAVMSIALGSLAAGGIYAQDYPNKPIRILTAPAGGGTDFTARTVAAGIQGPLGQTLVIDNRPLFPAVEAVAKAPPDGYTVLIQGISLWIVPMLQTTSYDVLRDFTPITLIERTVSVLAVHPSVPAKSVQELIALAKAHPGQLNYSTGVLGGASHLGMEVLKAQAGVNIVLVSYKGLGAAMTGLIAGEVHMTISDAGVILPQAKAGKLRALAVTSATPSTTAPGLPTVASSGLPGYESVGTTGMFAPAKTPTTIITRLNQEVVRLVNQPDVKAKLFNGGVESVGTSPEETLAYIKTDIEKKGKVIRDAHIKVD